MCPMNGAEEGKGEGGVEVAWQNQMREDIAVDWYL